MNPDPVPALVIKVSENPEFTFVYQRLVIFGSGLFIAMGLALILVSLIYMLIYKKTKLKKIDRWLTYFFVFVFVIFELMIIFVLSLPLMNELTFVQISNFTDLPSIYTPKSIAGFLILLYILFPLAFATRFGWMKFNPLYLRYLMLLGVFVAAIPLIMLSSIVMMEQVFFDGKICLGATCPAYQVVEFL